MQTSRMATYQPIIGGAYLPGVYAQFAQQCSSCGITDQCAKFCGGCTGTVCNICMTDGDTCCLLCQHYGSRDGVAEVQSTCGNCGTSCSSPTSCHSCANAVCNVCMVAEEGCCLLCLETFPVFPSLRPACQPHLMMPVISTMAFQPTNVEPLSPLKANRWADVEPISTLSPAHSAKGYSSESTCFDEDGDGSGSNSSTEATTLMICNVPCRLTQSDIVKAIHTVGFVNRYDFVHMPGRRHGSKRNGNMGYAFVNFKNTQDAEQFTTKFEGYQFPDTCSSKRCTVKSAHHQGFNGVDCGSSPSLTWR